MISPTLEPNPIMLLDEPHLVTIRFLAGRKKRSYAYRFELGTTTKIIILPNSTATSLQQRSNILFTPKAWHLYDPSRDGPLSKASRKRKAAPQNEDQDEEEEIPEEVYGSRRYDFEPYSQPIAGDALRAAHEHIGLLKRLTKWQGKQIKKLVKTVKKQGKLLKKLLKDSSSPTRRDENVDMTMAMTVGEQEGEGAGPSTHQARNKGKAPISPSSSGSGNYSYSMDYSSSPTPSN